MEKIGIIILLIIYTIVFLYNMAKEYNPVLSRKIYKSKLWLINRLKLNINVENRRFTIRQVIILLILVLFTLFLTNRMILILLLVVTAVMIPKCRMNFETFSKVFESYNPNIKKYNIYLLFLIIAESCLLYFTIFYFR